MRKQYLAWPNRWIRPSPSFIGRHSGTIGSTLDGVSLRVRRQSGRKRVQLLVVYRVRADGMRQLLAYTRSTGESQTA